MSEMMLNILDGKRAVHRRTHASFADYVAAALSAEPETIHDLETALGRFLKPGGEWGVFDGWSNGICEDVWDAGIGFIDLPGRLVAIRSSYSSPAESGSVPYHDGRQSTNVRVAYLLWNDWQISNDVQSWRTLSDKRRGERLAQPPLDVRAVLYGKLAHYVVTACLAAKTPGAKKPIADIHAQWLLTPRVDLHDRSPRELLLEKREYIDLDLQYRCNQWSRQRACPPGLPPESAAYRFAGFGTHEIVVYYDLVRFLLHDAWSKLSSQNFADVSGEIARLQRLQEEWLRTTQGDEGDEQFVPREVIDRERRRLPQVAAEDAHVFDDCPMCQLMASGDFGPTFWHFDGSQMDNEFAFSFCRTLEEWKAEQAEWADWPKPDGETLLPDEPTALASSESPWKRSFGSMDRLIEPGCLPGPQLVLMSLAAHVAELKLDVRESPSSESFDARLDRDFGNLTEAVQKAQTPLVEPIVTRFCENLEALEETRSDLAAKCEDLQRQLLQVVTYAAKWEHAAPQRAKHADDGLPL